MTYLSYCPDHAYACPGGTAHLTAVALDLLNRGCSPEQVEDVLTGALPHPDERTALSDPTNVLMKEVTGDGTPPRTG